MIRAKKNGNLKTQRKKVHAPNGVNSLRVLNQSNSHYGLKEIKDIPQNGKKKNFARRLQFLSKHSSRTDRTQTKVH